MALATVLCSGVGGVPIHITENQTGNVPWSCQEREPFSVGIAKAVGLKSGLLLALFVKLGKRFSEDEVQVEES